MTTSKHDNVRLAALEALGIIGTPSAVKHLAETAATAHGQERNVARTSLVCIAGEGIAAALMDATRLGNAGSRVQVIHAIGRRGRHEPFDALHQIARSEPVASIRREAIRSMGKIGKGSDIRTLLELAIAPKAPADRATIEEAVVTMFNKTAEADTQALPVLAALKKAPDEAKPVLLSLLRRPATPEALDAVRKAVKSSNESVSGAAIRTLGEWPNAAALDQLYQIASTGKNSAHKTLALRGYIRLARLTQDPMAVYTNALKLATQTDEIRLVLEGLHHAASLKALETAEKYIVNEALKADAFMAVVKVADVYCWQDSTRAKTALDRVMAQAPNENIRTQASKVIRKMKEHKGLVVAWRAAGPYKLNGVNDGRRVFETPFAPEKDPDSKDIVWRIVLPQFEGDKRINLERTFGGIDYCCAYVRTIVHSPVSQKVRITWSVDDFIRGWLNGQAIKGDTIQLREGANTLMLKVGDHGGGWNFRCEILKPNGSPAEGLRFDLEQ